jgi:hypothetical protein
MQIVLFRVTPWAYQVASPNLVGNGLTYEWVHFETSGTPLDTSQSKFRVIHHVGGATPAFGMYIYGVQIEEKAHASKFVDGTRSHTNGWRDLSGEDHHANMDLDKITYSATNVPGTNVNNFDLSGSTSNYSGHYIDESLYSANAMTISAWINMDVVPASQPQSYPCILSKRHSASTTERSYFFAFVKSSSYLYFEIKGTDHTYYTHSSTKTDWAANTWYYVSASYNAVTGFSKLYIDGQPHTGTVSPAQPWTTATNPLSEIPATPNVSAYVGRTSQGTYMFDGQIDVVKFYDRALSAVEVLQNFNASKGRYGL